MAGKLVRAMPVLVIIAGAAAAARAEAPAAPLNDALTKAKAESSWMDGFRVPGDADSMESGAQARPRNLPAARRPVAGRASSAAVPAPGASRGSDDSDRRYGLVGMRRGAEKGFLLCALLPFALAPDSFWGKCAAAVLAVSFFALAVGAGAVGAILGGVFGATELKLFSLP